MFKYRNIYIRRQNYKFQYRNICSSTELYLSTEICSRPRVEANNFADLFCGKCGCILLESYFLAQSVEIKSRKLELLAVLVVERWLRQALAQLCIFFRYHFQFRTIQRAKGKGKAFIQRQREVHLPEGKITRFRSLHHHWLRKTGMQGERLPVELMSSATARDILEAVKKKCRIFTRRRLRRLDAWNVWS